MKRLAGPNQGLISFTDLGITLKEIKESRFWLKVISKSKILKPEQIETLITECEELSAIIAKSIITAKSKNVVLNVNC
jgi:four helix bundle protein